MALERRVLVGVVMVVVQPRLQKIGVFVGAGQQVRADIGQALLHGRAGFLGHLDGAVEVVALLIQDARLDAAPRGTGALVASTGVESGPEAGSEAIVAKALTHVTAKWPDRASRLPAAHHVLRLSYGRAGRAPETAGIDDDAALARAVRDASRILEIRLRPEDIRAFARRTWEMPLPSGDPSPFAQSGVTLVGDWVAGPGLASVIPWARETAGSLLAEARARDEGRLPPRNRSPRTSNRPQESLA